MKLTSRHLRGLVKEELDRLLSEQAQSPGLTIEYDTYENQYDQTDWYFLVNDGSGDRSVSVRYTSVPNVSDIAWHLMDNSGISQGLVEDSPEELAMQAEVVRQIESSPHWKRDVAEATQAMYDYPGY